MPFGSALPAHTLLCSQQLHLGPALPKSLHTEPGSSAGLPGQSLSPSGRGGRSGRRRHRGACEKQFNLFDKLEESGEINSSVASKRLWAVIYSTVGTLPHN